MENQRYDVILFDADRTLFDFDRSQLDALREVFQTHGIPATQEMMDLYIRINNHLWGQFDRGEITTEELTRVRFRLFLEEAGDQGQDPAAMNRQYLESLGSHSYLLDGAEALCRELAPYCKQYIVTNGIKVAQVGRLNTSPIRPYIEKMYISGEMGIRKPEAGFFQIVYDDPGDDAGAVEADGDCGRRPGLGHFGRRNAHVDTIWYNPAGKENRTGIIPTWEAADFPAVRKIILGEV